MANPDMRTEYTVLWNFISKEPPVLELRPFIPVLSRWAGMQQ
jgi:hypothetical protein